MPSKTSVTIKGVKQAQDNALKFLNTRSQDKKVLQDIGSELVLQIQRRTTARLDEYKQDPLAETTIVSREILSASNNLNEFSQPKRSNLTLTGQLLSAISIKIIQGSSSIVLFLKDARSPYKKPTKESINAVAQSKSKSKRGIYYAIGNLILQNTEKNKSNTQIKRGLESQGRKFLFMSAKLKLQLENSIRKELSRQLTLYNKIRQKLSL